MKFERSEMVPAGEACLRFQAALPDYLGGDDCPEVAAHAARCEYCYCLLADLELVRSAGSGPALEEPPARVWANIRSALVAEGVIHKPVRNFRGFPWHVHGLLRYQIPVAAAAAVAVVAVVLFKAPGYFVRTPFQSAAYTLHAAAFMQGDVAPREMASLQEAAAELEKSYQENRASLEPSTRAVYEKSLDSIDSEIRECQTSMKNEPANGLAQEYLSRAYVEKAQLLETALDYNLR